MEMYWVSCKKYTAILNKTDKCFYQILLFVVEKNKGSLKIKKVHIKLIIPNFIEINQFLSPT